MNNLGLLILRVTAGGLMLTHGWPKLVNFEQIATRFPDPIGLGTELSLVMAIFSELVCALLLVVGVFSRAASLPLIFTMIVAAFVVHGADPFQKKELALIYLGMYLCTLLMGPGDYSLSKALGLRKYWQK